MTNPHRLQHFAKLKDVGATPVWRLKGAGSHDPFFFDSAVHVDFDGASKCYAPRGVPGALDDLGNAGHPGNWWGVVTSNGQGSGQPIIQSGATPSQPDRGFYISPTSLVDAMYATQDVRRYTDATRVPYVALPPKHLSY